MNNNYSIIKNNNDKKVSKKTQIKKKKIDGKNKSIKK
jgi:hypothetical protein